MAKKRNDATRIDLEDKTRDAMVALLNRQLADAVDLYTQVKQAHWNVKGPHFIALHELFDKLGEELEGHIDDIAERAVALGAVAVGTANGVVEQRQLAKYPLQISEGLAHVDALANGYATFGKSVREAIDEAARAGDADTSDLFTGISRGVDKDLWLLEAHLQAKN